MTLLRHHQSSTPTGDEHGFADGDDEILESLVKTATKTTGSRPATRERKRTRHADRKSCECLCVPVFTPNQKNRGSFHHPIPIAHICFVTFETLWTRFVFASIAESDPVQNASKPSYIFS